MARSKNLVSVDASALICKAFADRLGWIVALIWSTTNDAPAQVIIKEHPQKTSAEELAHLFDLKTKGVITEEEFKAKKAKMLSL